MSQLVEPAELATRFINQTQRSIFLTGKAGTGKTTLLHQIIASTHKQVVVVAPTGIAALNAGGVTIHSQFQLPFAGFIPDFGVAPSFSDKFKMETRDSLMRHFNMSAQRKAVLKNMQLLIIDEVSMLRADLLDAIDWTLRNIRKINQPFGGVQVLYIGDLLQLPPVVKPEEWTLLRKYYQGVFFFHAQVIREDPPVYIELTKVFRQRDERFIDVLNNLRNNQITTADLDVLNEFVNPDFDAKSHEGYITLTTHNAKADEMNQKSLRELAGESVVYDAEVTGDFPPHMFPLDAKLELKVGAQVMFVKNDMSFDKQYYNGKMGTIKSLSPKEIRVHFPQDNKTIEVETYEWENIRYSVDENTQEIREEVLGSFVHYPLKLAWAITVHKSQGLTFEKAVLDVSQVFAPGQAYVALSRLRSLDGLVLLTPMRMNGLTNDQHVMQYATNKASESQLGTFLERETKTYLLNSLKSAFDWYELDAQWRIHEASYAMAGAKSEKSKHKSWAYAQASALHNLLDPAQKFCNQLDNLFRKEPFDLGFVQERMQAAYTYFDKTLDNIVYSTLKKMEEVRKLSKIKAYFEELQELDELQTAAVLNLKKARLLLEVVLSGRDANKETVQDEEITHYKLAKIALIRQEMRQSGSLMDVFTADEDEEADVIQLRTVKKPKSREKTEKKSTYQQTLELLQENKTIEQVADQRKMSVSTISNHIEKLIKAEKLSIQAVFSSEKIAALKAIFSGYEEESLTPLKEKHGDTFTWEELKIYRASLLL